MSKVRLFSSNSLPLVRQEFYNWPQHTDQPTPVVPPVAIPAEHHPKVDLFGFSDYRLVISERVRISAS